MVQASRIRNSWLLWMFVLAAGLRLAALGRDPWLDEFSSQALAQHPAFWEAFARHSTPPLYFGLLRLWGLWGESVPWLRLLSLGLSLGAVGWVWGTGRRVSFRVAWMGALWMSVAPAALDQSISLRPYPLLQFWVAALIFFGDGWRRWPQRSGYGWGVAVCLAALAVTHLVGLLFTPLVCVGLVLSPQLRHRAGWFAGAGALGVGIAWGWVGSEGLHPLWRPEVNFAYLMWSLWGHLELTEHGRWLGRVLGGGALASPLFLFIEGLLWKGGALLLVGVLCFNVRRWVLPGALGLGYFVALLGVSWTITPVLLDRTLSPLVVPIALMLGVAVGTTRGRWAAVSTGALVYLAVGSVQSWVGERAFGSKEQWVTPLAQASHLWRPGDLFLFHPPYLRKEGLGRHWVTLPAQLTLPRSAAPGAERLAREWVVRRLGAGQGRLFYFSRAPHDEEQERIFAHYIGPSKVLREESPRVLVFGVGPLVVPLPAFPSLSSYPPRCEGPREFTGE